ncbi:MAG: energy-coupling factor transporter transmembrane component T family protein [Promethearchaeota archaeon]
MSIELLSAFQFLDREDFIHKLDPRIKMLMVLIYLILLMIFKDIIIQLFILLTLIPLIITGHMGKTTLKTLRGMGFLYFFIIFFNTLFVLNGGFNLGIQMALRLTNIMISFSLLFQTTSPNDLSQALVKMGVPYHIAFSLSLAFRFVPTLAQETETITDAQKSRGLEIQKGGMLQQLKNLFPLLIPLISNSIQRAYYIAESLEARSFGINIKKRTYLFPIKMKPTDYLLLFWILFLFIAGLYLYFNLNSFPNWFQFSLQL